MARRVSLLVVVAALFLAPSAIADPSVETYGGKGGQTQSQLGGNDVNGGPTSGTQSATSAGSAGGGLPFTGLDLAFMLGGGLVLLAVGASLARLVPREHV
jgi:hypothetical protein